MCIYVIHVSSFLLAADLQRTELFLGEDLWKDLTYESRNDITQTLLLVWGRVRREHCEQKQFVK